MLDVRDGDSVAGDWRILRMSGKLTCAMEIGVV